MNPLSEFPCPIEKAQEILGKKWSILLIRDMYAGKVKFTDFLRENPSLSTRMLALRLRELEENGFVDKRIVSKTPVRAEYFLTKKGYSVRKILLALSLFSLEFHPDFEMNKRQHKFVENSLISYFSKD